MTDLIRDIGRTDEEIIDWLQDECNGTFSCKRKRDCVVESPTYGELDIWKVFTCVSQHVTGSSIRDALSNAMDKAEEFK